MLCATRHWWRLVSESNQTAPPFVGGLNGVEARGRHQPTQPVLVPSNNTSLEGCKAPWEPHLLEAECRCKGVRVALLSAKYRTRIGKINREAAEKNGGLRAAHHEFSMLPGSRRRFHGFLRNDNEDNLEKHQKTRNDASRNQCVAKLETSLSGLLTRTTTKKGPDSHEHGPCWADGCCCGDQPFSPFSPVTSCV